MNPLIRRLKALFLALTVILPLTAVTLSANGEDAAAELPNIENVIIMIPDGGGFGNYDLAEALKLSGGGIPGMRTPLTTDAIEGEVHEGLYLSDYMIGTSKTRCVDNEVTDSAAGGTAISCGQRTNKYEVGQTADGMPIASILEACQLMGKSTGLLTTSTWYDATPASFASHVKVRTEYDRIRTQIMNHNIDIVLGGSSDWGNSLGDFTASDFGYTVVDNAEGLKEAVDGGAARIWSNFAEENANLSYDFADTQQPTLLEMTQSAIKLLDENSGNDNGFFLMIEGGGVDKAAHASNVLGAVSEYLSFDETFAYVVNWAKKDGHTLVYGVPDHDTGGLEIKDLDAVLSLLNERKNPSEGVHHIWNGHGEHTGQNVPIWLYAPDGVREKFLNAVGIPTDVKPKNVRDGKFYNGVTFNEKYAVDNCNLAKGAEAVLKFDFDEATDELFTPLPFAAKILGDTLSVGELHISIGINYHYYFDQDGRVFNFPIGLTVLSDGDDIYAMLPKKTVERLCRYKNPYTDVSYTEWYYSSIISMYVEKIMNGKDIGVFGPDENMTRAEFVTILARLSGDDVSGASENMSFTDTSKDAWYADYVGWASKSGIVGGYEDNTFRPDYPVTREEMAALLMRFIRDSKIDVSSDKSLIDEFKDRDDISEWAVGDVEAVRLCGLFAGDENGFFYPQAYSSRAEIATVVDRMIYKYMSK